MKNWILDMPFVRAAFADAVETMRKEEQVKAFSFAHRDILDTMKDDLDKRGKELAQEILQGYLTVIDRNLVVRLDQRSGAVYIGQERADQARLANLKSEAEFLLESDIWKILTNSLREIAQRAMFVAGDSIDDMKKGRSVLYTLDSQDKIVETFRAFIPTPVHKNSTQQNTAV